MMLADGEILEKKPAEETPEASGAQGGCQPDQGYNQWVEFHIRYVNFPTARHGVALKSEDDIDLVCGKLYVGTKDIELERFMLPRPIYPDGASASPLGACGRSCAAMGTQGAIILSEQTRLGEPETVGVPVLRIRWRCLYSSYADNYFQAFSLNSHYQITKISTPPTDRALGEMKIEVTYCP